MALESFLKYYQNELEFLINEGKIFSNKHPNIAQSLDFSSFDSSDPDVKKLIESVAFLNAKLQKRIDEQAPEISKEILNAIYPQFISPVPSFCIMNFSIISKPNSGTKIISKNTKLTSKTEFNKQFYTFKTTTDVEIAPFEITNSELIKPSLDFLPMHIMNSCNNAIEVSIHQHSNYEVDELVFYINAIDEIAFNIYTALLSFDATNNTPIFENGIKIGEIEAIEFDSHKSYGPFETLIEYNACTRKFLFFKAKFSTKPQKRIIIPINSNKEMEMDIHIDTFLLNCTPAVNLFEKNSQPINVNNENVQYKLNADFQKDNHTVIHSILSIKDANFQNPQQYLPYFSHQHILGNNENYSFFLEKRDENSVFLSFLQNGKLEPKILYAKLLCTQQDADKLIKPSSEWNINETPGNVKCINLDKPTAMHKSLLNSQTQWRLISHLAIDYFGFENKENLNYIKELFTIYDFQNSKNKNILFSLKEMSYELKMSYINGSIIPMASVELIVDEKISNEVFIVARIIGYFLSQNININTKMELILKKQSDDSIWKRWNII